MENAYKYKYLIIVMSINSFSALNITVNTVMKYYHNRALNKKLKLMGVTMNFLGERLQGLNNLALWSTVLRFFFYFEKFVKPSAPLLHT